MIWRIILLALTWCCCESSASSEFPLKLQDVNVLVVTDVHSWVAGHSPHEPEFDVDYGNVLSFYQKLKSYCDYKKKDLFFVMNGDFMDGTGLSSHPPVHLLSILKQMPWDAINVGNHELYMNSTIQYLTEDKSFIDSSTWKDRYITSNVRLSSNNETVGNRFRFLNASHSNSNILTLGFLYDMVGHSALTIVDRVEDVVQSTWFQQVLNGTVKEFDAVLVLAHMDVVDPLINIILSAIRNICGPRMPVQFITGHTHKRAYQIIDPYSTSAEAGKYLETIGFVSFPLNQNPLNDNNNYTENSQTLVNNTTNTTITNITNTTNITNNTNTTTITNTTNTTTITNTTDDTTITNSTNTTTITNTTDTTTITNTTDTTTITNTTNDTTTITNTTNTTTITNTTNTTITNTNTTTTEPNTTNTINMTNTTNTTEPNTIAARTIEKGNFTTQFFTHVFLDANKLKLQKALNLHTLDTPDGIQLSKFINETQHAMGLKRILGCAPMTYHLDKGLDQYDSLWGIYSRKVISETFFKRNTSKIFIDNIGSLRYNLFNGPISETDLVSTSPFNNTVFVITERLLGSDFIQAFGSPNKVDGTNYFSDFHQYVVVNEVKSNKYYDIYTSKYNKYIVTDLISNVTNSTHEPRLLSNGDVTTGTLWRDFITRNWTCATEVDDKRIVPAFFKSVGEFFKRLVWWKATAMAITMILFCCFACFFIGPFDCRDNISPKDGSCEDSVSSSSASSRYYDEMYTPNYDSRMGISAKSDDCRSMGSINSLA